MFSIVLTWTLNYLNFNISVAHAVIWRHKWLHVAGKNSTHYIIIFCLRVKKNIYINTGNLASCLCSNEKRSLWSLNYLEDRNTYNKAAHNLQNCFLCTGYPPTSPNVLYNWSVPADITNTCEYDVSERGVWRNMYSTTCITNVHFVLFVQF